MSSHDHDSAHDIVVVGGGTAGCVLAARLTQNGDTRVLLLEAGSAALPDAAAHPPAWPSLATSEAAWGDTTVVQHASGSPVAFPRGKGLGGSSAINAMVFSRGHRTSYDSWNEHGAKGWSFDDLLPYFQRSDTAVSRAPSRGSLRIASADPYAPPVIDPNYFAAEQDVRAVLSGIATARRIAWSSALAEWGIEEISPGLDAVDEESLGDFTRKHFGSYCHPVGTCVMGEDDASVVDSDLRVHGLDGLRVADASVIPSVPSSNTNATVYALAERAADLLRRSGSRTAQEGRPPGI